MIGKLTLTGQEGGPAAAQLGGNGLRFLDDQAMAASGEAT